MRALGEAAERYVINVGGEEPVEVDGVPDRARHTRRR